ncbi:MAG: HDIG domain-containing protein [Candidatus Omnitrophica bacterium]|nr:HDIG domain-containing protein [Candidatus Omnitrophota bacterium]MDD5488089.1 HDIG domain-containing protein [Candidatus Omnitrophota bacterium]
MIDRERLRKVYDSILGDKALLVLFIFLFMVAAIGSMFVSPQLYKGNMHVGDIALKNIYAPYDFTYQWDIDEKRTAEAKDAAVKAVPFYFRRDRSVERRAENSVNVLFDNIEDEKASGGDASGYMTRIKEDVSFEISEKNIKLLAEYKDTHKLRQKSIKILNRIFRMGYVSPEDARAIDDAGASEVKIYESDPNREATRARNQLLTERGAHKAVEEYLYREFRGERRISGALNAVILPNLTPNLFLDAGKRQEKREEALARSTPVYRIWAVEKNELIVEKGKRLEPRHIAQLSQLRRFFRPGVTPVFFLGVLLLFLLLGVTAVIYSLLVRKVDVLKDTKNVAVILINMLLAVVVADLVTRSPQPSYFIPLAAMGMMIAVLVDHSIAIFSVMMVSVLISLLIGGGIELLFVLMTGAIVGIFSLRGLRRRANILWAGLAAGGAKFLAISCIGLINGMEPDFFFKDGMWGIASGVMSGFIVMGLLPVYEHWFKIPTNISLLELSDLNHPLLKRLAMEAPGTYHHSIMVGNLAESACDAIGANSLLARVGAYYHDIGKINKPEYFTENEMGMGSRHSKLAPSMSALIISKHVKEGTEIARKHNLSKAIIDFISQHHGDGLIYYFYQKAVEKSEDGNVVNEENFRYPGPKPQTKESAIILLADSVEASSRTLDDPTPSSIRNLVRRIINNKFIDGQLDECDLTLKDMNKIADSFSRVLMGVFHARPEYPDEEKKQKDGGDDGAKNKPKKPKPPKKDQPDNAA